MKTENNTKAYEPQSRSTAGLGVKGSMNTLFGMKVMTSALVQPVPVLQLSPNFNACTDTFKAETNRWFLEMFGTKEVMYMIGKDTLVLNHAMLAKIKQSIPNHWTAPNV